MGNSDSFGSRFGALVKRKRTQQGLGLAALSSRLYPREDPTGERRAPDVLKFENGQTKKPRARTIRLYQDALGIAQEEIDALVDHTDRPQWLLTMQLIEQKADLAKKLQLSTNLAVEIAERYAEGNPGDLDGALRGLECALQVAAEESAKDTLSANTDDAVTAVLQRVDVLNHEGRIDDAAVLISEEEVRVEAGLIRLYDKGIAQAILTRNVDAAVCYELKKSCLDTPEPARQYDSLRGAFIQWYKRGNEKGLNFDAEVAIAIMRRMSERFAQDRDKKHACLNNLGTALMTLGERENDTVRLEEARVAYLAALKEVTRDRAPLQWAKTQMNFGNALTAFGKRENDTARLQEAVAAFRAALEERTREREPLGWATIQMNLGTALSTLGERENDTVRLEEAGAAYVNALMEVTRERAPLQWAAIEMNLGVVFARIARRENNSARFEEAVSAFRSALEVRTRDRVPLDWAEAQTSLGTALSSLGKREKDTNRLQEAVAAFRAALEEHTRDRVPLQWARTQMSLGNALKALGEIETDTAHLEEAVTAIRLALKENRRDSVPREWARNQMNLGNALKALGEIETDTARLEEAITVIGLALKEMTRNRTPNEWAHLRCNQAEAMLSVAERCADLTLAQNALDQLIKTEAAMCEDGHAVVHELASSIDRAEAIVACLSRSRESTSHT